jgi:hypothetical protein
MGMYSNVLKSGGTSSQEARRLLPGLVETYENAAELTLGKCGVGYALTGVAGAAVAGRIGGGGDPVGARVSQPFLRCDCAWCCVIMRILPPLVGFCSCFLVISAFDYALSLPPFTRASLIPNLSTTNCTLACFFLFVHENHRTCKLYLPSYYSLALQFVALVTFSWAYLLHSYRSSMISVATIPFFLT